MMLWFAGSGPLKSKGGGKTLIFDNAEPTVAELLLCIVITVNQLSIWGAIADLHQEVNNDGGGETKTATWWDQKQRDQQQQKRGLARGQKPQEGGWKTVWGRDRSNQNRECGQGAETGWNTRGNRNGNSHTDGNVQAKGRWDQQQQEGWGERPAANRRRGGEQSKRGGDQKQWRGKFVPAFADWGSHEYVRNCVCGFFAQRFVHFVFMIERIFAIKPVFVRVGVACFWDLFYVQSTNLTIFCMVKKSKNVFQTNFCRR